MANRVRLRRKPHDNDDALIYIKVRFPAVNPTPFTITVFSRYNYLERNTEDENERQRLSLHT